MQFAGLLRAGDGCNPSLAEESDLFRVRDADAEQVFRPCEKCSVTCLRFRRLAGEQSTTPVGQLAAGGFQNQLRRALAGPIADAHVRAALEAVAGFAAQAELLAGAADVGRM